MKNLLGDTLANIEAGAAPVRISHRRADGVVVAAEASASRIGEGPTRLTTLMLRDVGDRERLEEAARARIEAESASRTKTLMMTYIAHEMGNPLNGLLGFAQLMVDDHEHPIPAVQARRLDHVVTSGRRLEALMRDVLDLGRFEVGNLTMLLAPTDLARCVDAAMAAVSEQGRLCGVTLSSSLGGRPILASVDADRIHQCLLNLLTNAIKYNRAGGWARVDVESAAGEARIVVVDNGQGMDARQLQHLFEPFNRLGRQAEATPGAGMGLLITRQLVTAMQGRLRVESEPGCGSRFIMEFPMDAHAAMPD
jgi:signal transduction histidine kinase